MAVGIAHAVMSENKDRYGEVGDQLQTSATDDRKREIRLADWYDRSGGVKDGRWSGNKAIKSAGFDQGKGNLIVLRWSLQAMFWPVARSFRPHVTIMLIPLK